MAYRDVVQSDSPLYYWPMDEASGTELAALAGGITLTLGTSTAKPTLGVAGMIDGTCCQFDGSNDHAYTTSALSLSGYSAIVVEAWVWWDAFANNDKLLMEYTTNFNAASGAFIVDPNSGAPLSGQFQSSSKGNVGTSSAGATRPTAAAWHLFHFGYDFTKATNESDIWIDGVLQSVTRATNNNNTGAFANDTLYLFSRNKTSLNGAGKMQHLAIYSALSDARKTAHFNATTTGSVRSLVNGGLVNSGLVNGGLVKSA